MVYLRQNLLEGMHHDFSCGISWISPGGASLTLRRYNGPSHRHKNHLEGDSFQDKCHIHYATEKYINSNRRPEGFAKITDRFTTLNGALHCLVQDCNITGILTNPDTPSQFSLFE